MLAHSEASDGFRGSLDAMGTDDKSPALTRRRKVETEAEKAERLAKAQAALEKYKKVLGKQKNSLDDLEYVMLAALLVGLVAMVLTCAGAVLYFHLEGMGQPVIHAGDAPQYESCDRLSQVGSRNDYIFVFQLISLKASNNTPRTHHV